MEPDALNAKTTNRVLKGPIISLLGSSVPAATTSNTASTPTTSSQEIYLVGTALLTVGGSAATIDGYLVSAASAGIVSDGITLAMTKTTIKAGGIQVTSLAIISTEAVTATATTQLVTTALITFAPAGAQNGTVTDYSYGPTQTTTEIASAAGPAFVLPTERAPPACGGKGPCSEGLIVLSCLRFVVTGLVSCAVMMMYYG